MGDSEKTSTAGLIGGKNLIEGLDQAAHLHRFLQDGGGAHLAPLLCQQRKCGQNDGGRPARQGGGGADNVEAGGVAFHAHVGQDGVEGMGAQQNLGGFGGI